MAKKRGKPPGDLPRVSVSLPVEHRARLEQIAIKHVRSVAWVVRHAVRLFLQEMDRGQLSLDLEPGLKER